LECNPAVLSELPWNSFPSKACKRNSNTGVIVNEMTVEIGEAEEGLNILDFPRLGPILDDLDFSGVHGETFRR
jgi:hypothetical protein